MVWLARVLDNSQYDVKLSDVSSLNDMVILVPRQPFTAFHVTTVAMCNASDVEKLPSSGIEPEIFCFRGSCSNH